MCLSWLSWRGAGLLTTATWKDLWKTVESRRLSLRLPEGGSVPIQRKLTFCTASILPPILCSLSCKMITSHRSREQLVVLLLKWACWRETGRHSLADERLKHDSTIKERSEKSEECGEWESKNLPQRMDKLGVTLKLETSLEIPWSYVYGFTEGIVSAHCGGVIVLEVWGANKHILYLSRLGKTQPSVDKPTVRLCFTCVLARCPSVIWFPLLFVLKLIMLCIYLPTRRRQESSKQSLKSKNFQTGSGHGTGWLQEGLRQNRPHHHTLGSW